MNEQYTVKIESVDFEGKGIARVEGKTVFVVGAIADEEVVIEIIKHKKNFAQAKLISVLVPSKQRVVPACPNFGVCGGCSLQHIEFQQQVQIKQQVLIDNLKHIGQVSSLEVLAPLVGIAWGYRQRARLSVRYVAKKGGVLVGFRERASHFVTAMNECLVLPKHISDLIPALREMIGELSIKDRIAQIEVAVGSEISVLVLRNMEPLTSADEASLIQFIDKYSNSEYPLQFWLQPKAPESAYPFYPVATAGLSYQVPEFQLIMPYYPSEFTQVNNVVNQQMLALAIKLLDLSANERVVDFFCGIGNFSLAIARHAASVLGIEGSDGLVKRAMQNARLNDLITKVSYQNANLFQVDSGWLATLGKFDKWLIDPPRDGAYELVKAITPAIAPKKIVYVSCNPATLARDANILVYEHSYQLVKTGIMNMFPHTTHVESIAVFKLRDDL